MADKKISELTALTGANVATDDQLVIVDTSAALTKSITIDEFKNALDTATGFVRITGDTMTGDLSMSGANITLGDSSGVSDDRIVLGDDSDLLIYHNNPNSFIRDQGNGNFFITTDGNYIFLAKDDLTNMATFQVDGPVDLYHAGSAKLATTSTGIAVTGDATFADNGKAIFGAGSDLQIYHDGSESIIKDAGTGNLKILATDLRINNADSSKSYITGVDGSYVNLYYNGSQKLVTTSTGVDITGTLTSDGLTVDGLSIGGTGGLEIEDPSASGYGAHFSFYDASSEVVIGGKTAGTTNKSLSIGRDTGDISFYEDTGTTPKFFWDADAESLGIGTSSPNRLLHIHAASGTNGRIHFSNATTGTTTADGFFIGQDGGDGNVSLWNFENNYLRFATNNSERMRISSDGSCRWTPDGTNPDMTLDASGNLLVGQTSINYNAIGGSISAGGTLRACADSFHAASFNRKTLDGDIAIFYKDGSPVGSIGVDNNDNLTISGNSGHSGLMVNTSSIIPYANGAISDNTEDLGTAAFRWKDLYLSGASKHGTGGRTKVEAAKIYDDATNGNSVGIFFGGGQYNGPATGNTGAAADNAVDIGNSSYRFKDLYLSGGVYLGGTGSANKLDDYEEGSFLPFTGIGSGYTGEEVENAQYTKIGRMVYINLRMRWTGTDGSGNPAVFIMPFTHATATNTGTTGAIMYSGTQLKSGAALIAHMASNSNELYIYRGDGGTFNTVKRSEINGSYDFAISFCYYVA